MQSIELTDTHCHIHEAQYHVPGDGEVQSKWLSEGKPDPDLIIEAATKAGVTRLICVGTTVQDSEIAVLFAQGRPMVWASIGIHPHDSDRQLKARIPTLADFSELANSPKVVAVGECGLDYFYEHSSKQSQVKLLRFQIELALSHNLPLIFHVRDAFEDFWTIFDEYPGIKGVIHSFSASKKELKQILSRNLYVGVNGIMTFTKRVEQLDAARAIPLNRLVLETDAPFLTPAPLRGKLCKPEHMRLTAEFLSRLRGETLAKLAAATTHNAQELFGLGN